jgi:methylmalonyl-CoA mutase N-terminal domain/subunit
MGYFQREIAESASDYQRRVDSKRRIIVGVNEFNKDSEGIDIPLMEISEKVQSEQIISLAQLKTERNSDLVKNKLSAITTAAENGDNLIPLIIDAAKSYCTLGEIVDSMKVVFGEWKETAVI